MKKCQSPDYPHCTRRVVEGDIVCSAGHRQRQNNRRLELLAASADKLTPLCEISTPAKLFLHFSGYDPRSAGGRQTIRLEVCGTFPVNLTEVEVNMQSELLEAGAISQRLRRAASGLWQPMMVSFSSKNKEHGQYPIEITLTHGRAGEVRRKWVCSSTILIPRADASLTEIHSVFLAAQRNIKVMAEDGAIATLNGLELPASYAQGSMTIEINAKDAAIAKLDMRPPTGKYEVALGALAWDEEFIEITPEPEILNTVCHARPKLLPQVISAKTVAAATNWASLVGEKKQAYSTIRLLALHEWVLGRMETQHPRADILLCHRAGSEAENIRLSRRISARHAIIRRTETGVDMLDTSRYGILLDGVAVAKGRAYPLNTGMQIEFCASVRGIAKLQVIAIQAHVIILADINNNSNVAKDLYYLLSAETRPVSEGTNTSITLPEIFHFQGGFWYRNRVTRRDTRLDACTDMSVLPHLPSGCHYCSSPYTGVNGFGAWRGDDKKI